MSETTASIGKIVFGTGVTFGDGGNNGPDMAIAGKVGSLDLSNIKANTLFTLGTGLSYPQSIKNRPNIKLNDVLAPT